jgi:hypothetical protein
MLFAVRNNRKRMQMVYSAINSAVIAGFRDPGQRQGRDIVFRVLKLVYQVND